MYWAISISILLNVFFNSNLKKKFGGYRFLEIGFHLNFFLSLYIIIPTVVFITSSFTVGDPISYVFNGFAFSNESLFIKHIIKMLVFQLVFIVAYLKTRNNKIIKYETTDFKFKKTFIIVLSLILAICYILLIGLSSDFDGYIESYQRYDHLNRPLRLFVSFIVRFKFAFIVLFLIHFFIYYKGKKIILIIGFLCLMIVEAYYSSGARISILFLLFQGFGLYVIVNGLPKIKNILIGSLICLVLFTVIEKSRIDSEDDVTNELAGLLPGEFGSVFFTSYHLYQKRDDNQLPNKSYKMLFFDFISPLIPNADLDEIDPIFWYQKNYFPSSEVPPFTLGPIANTAIWEGEIGLVLRAWLCALLFGEFSNYITRRKIIPFYLFIYLSVFSTTVMVMKYSIFYHFTPFIKNLIFPFILFLILRYIFTIYSKNTLAKPDEISR